ncbi:hypothetical protein [Microbacterium sp. SA39]|uniref:hypothetical protein n=1 Tax=Microbacterium sp. SA39 TaxID=1263625 RepID=UPI00126A2116|nr:hypothetical protein [Microbacterium sp. SA39]
MALSFEEFRASLVSADGRGRLGIQLTDAEAQQVHADPASAQSWYAYWLSTPAAAAAVPAAPQVPPVPTAPAGDHDLTRIMPAAPVAYAAASPYPSALPPTSAAETPKKKNVGLWVSLSILGALLLIAAIVVVFAFSTARHWTKVDVPEKPETFHSEEFETGRFDVAMDTVNPCVVDQDWTDCINAMQAQYDANCAGVELTESATSLCADYLSAIDEMRALDEPGSYVATLGDYGSLSRTAEIDTREVSNNDQQDAVTHEAVCYLGFLGECE